MGLPLRPASAVAWSLNGAKSGLKTGLRLSTAAIDVVRINEAHHLYPL